MHSKKASITAYCIPCGLTKLSRMPRWKQYFSDELIQLNTAFMLYARDTPAKYFASWLYPELYIRTMDAIFIRSMVHHFLFRKRYIEDRVQHGISQGTEQVIILGAGFDTLALRLALKHPVVQFFELDLPNTQLPKVKILERIHHAIPDNCRFIPADLAQHPLESILNNEQKFKASAATIVILEGVLMYLSQAEVKALFTTMRQLFTGTFTTIFGAISVSDNESNWRVRLLNACRHKGQDETKWYCPSHDMAKFMEDLGYTLQDWISYKDLQRLYRDGQEINTVPEEDENYYSVTKTS